MIYAPINKKPAGNTGKVVAAGSAKKVESGNVEWIAPSQTRDASGPISNGVNVEGYSIYIRGLSLNASVSQVEEEFKKFGEIKPNGVQVRSNKGFCFGFIEFASAESKQSAIEAARITIGNHTAYVEEKKTLTKVGPTGRPRYPQEEGLVSEMATLEDEGILLVDAEEVMEKFKLILNFCHVWSLHCLGHFLCHSSYYINAFFSFELTWKEQ